MTRSDKLSPVVNNVLNDDFRQIVELISLAKQRAVQKVNEELINLYFGVGKIVSQKISSAQWGSSVVDELALFIKENHPEIKGFSRRGLYRMRQFYESYQGHSEFVSSLPSQIPQGIFKDTYILDFLNLPNSFSEKTFQKALVENLKEFILELGKGFSFVGNEYRVEVGNHDYFLDLLFFHRDLQCLVAIELKVEEFKPEFLGKMNFYLEVLDRDLKKEHENPSIGILLCKSKDREVVEFSMARNISPAMVAEYETKLISKEILQKKFHELLMIADDKNA